MLLITVLTNRNNLFRIKDQIMDGRRVRAMRRQRNCADTESYITCKGGPFNPCSDGLWDEDYCYYGIGFHKDVVKEIISKMYNAKKMPRYEPFANRTPLVCDDYYIPDPYNTRLDMSNGIGHICNPCGVPCTGRVNF